MLFRGEEVFKKIGTLSGGQKARLVLLKLVLDGANCLLLDEPTNHLDILAKEAVEAALETFDGTVLLVSHVFGGSRLSQKHLYCIRLQKRHLFLEWQFCGSFICSLLYGL